MRTFNIWTRKYNQSLVQLLLFLHPLILLCRMCGNKIFSRILKPRKWTHEIVLNALKHAFSQTVTTLILDWHLCSLSWNMGIQYLDVSNTHKNFVVDSDKDIISTYMPIISFETYVNLIMIQEWRNFWYAILLVISSILVHFLPKNCHFYSWHTFKNSKWPFGIIHSKTTWNEIILSIEFGYACRNHVGNHFSSNQRSWNFCIVIFCHISCIFWTFWSVVNCGQYFISCNVLINED